ncbi:hypothetical protein ACFLWX_03735 [Chloroflexota bacterium]
MNLIQKSFMKAAAKGFRPMLSNMLVTMGDLCRAFYEKNGEEAIPIITEIMKKSGVKEAENIRKMMPVKDMKDVGELFNIMDGIMEMGMEVVEISDKSIHVKLPGCNLGLDGTSQELCGASMAKEMQMISTLLGQEMDSKIIKSVAAGDKECEAIFSVK